MTKRAVVVGVNDYSVQNINSLKGCVRDARAFHHLLVDAFDFEPANILTYLDLAATSTAILTALRFCVTQSQPGDVICFYYAGHGTRLPHPRHMDQAFECIIPAAGRWISDHELFLISDGLQPSHVNFTCIFDSCHSGGMSLEAQARTPPMEQTLIERIIQFTKTIVPCGVLLAPEERHVCENNVANVRLEDGRIDLDPDPNFTTVKQAKTTLVSGCRADELSWEAQIGGVPSNGLMTRSFLDLVNQSSFKIDYRSLADELRTRVAAHIATSLPGKKITQRPQLVGQDNRMGGDFLEGFTDSR